jgi:hypothetical protein
LVEAHQYMATRRRAAPTRATDSDNDSDDDVDEGEDAIDE